MADSLYVVLSGKESDFRSNGKLLNVSTYNSLEELKADAATKLGVASSAKIVFSDIHGNSLSSFDEVRTKDLVILHTTGHTAAAAAASGSHTPIPGPVGTFFFGNLYDLFPDPLNNMRKLFKTFSPLMKFSILGNVQIGTDDPAYVELMANESDTFWKRLVGPLAEFKPIGGQGLFTTNGDDPDWLLGHKILMPAFSPKAIKAYSHEMGSLANQLAVIFQTYADSGEPVLITKWMTNFTFETIGKTGFGYDFGLLDSPNAPVHPFISAMAFCLSESVNRVMQLNVYKKLPLSANYRYERERKLMVGIVDEVVKVRKEQIAQKKEVPKDLLTFMLTEKSSEGVTMSDSLIRDQVLTFLIAGHETTSNTLSWALFELDRNPHVLEACLQEIVNVGISDEVPTDRQITDMVYIERVVKETLRMHAPVRQVGKTARKDTTLPGNYFIPEGTHMHIAVDALHHNPHVFESPEVFDPDRFLPENESKRSVYSWMPFSYGARSCIGRQFAVQEAKVGLAVILRKFKFTTVDPSAVNYDPKNPTTSPVNLWMKVTPQTNLPSSSKELKSPARSLADLTGTTEIPAQVAPQTSPLPPITILYGSNTGTASDYAGTIAAKARTLSGDVVISSLDDFLPKLKTRLSSFPDDGKIHHLLMVVTATYNGTPPDNAGAFDKWITEQVAAKALPLKGTDFAVFGCGNKQWRTYQMFPAKVDTHLEKLGGRRFLAAGAGDANDDIDGDFNQFLRLLYSVVILNFGGQSLNAGDLEKESDLLDGFALKSVPPSDPMWSAARETEGNFNATILVNRELQNSAKSGRSTRHLEITVDSPYLPGDHLEVFPSNDQEIVESVAQGLGLALDATFVPTEIDVDKIASTRSIAASLPVNVPTTLRKVLLHRADLLGPPTRSIVTLFAKKIAAKDASAAEALKALAAPDAKKSFEEFQKKHRTLLDLMAAYPSVKEVSLAEFLCAVSAMTPRRYSIASSPLVHADRATLAVGVVQDVSPGSSKTYFGQCSGFFKRMGAVKECKVEAYVKSCKDSFRPPVDPKTPLIMICAGTGLSPFMGFLQDRKAKGFVNPNSETHLIFGCRNDDDFIYKQELEAFAAEGVISGLHVAFSRKDGHAKKYVQHVIIDEGVLLWKLLNDQRGLAYVCGAAGGMAKDVRRALERVATMIGGVPEESAGEWLESRYVEDVWG
ncbi:hypothetical protein HDU78_002447 [Chytriomyces hyalinus]|nr:hypothetical protein HDU78_002447 [Chytriomyces hyalinus]